MISTRPSARVSSFSAVVIGRSTPPKTPPVHNLTRNCKAYSAAPQVLEVPALRKLDLKAKTRQVELITGANCELAVGFYPLFKYDAAAGRSEGNLVLSGGSRVDLVFDPATSFVPSLDYNSTKVMGVPLPPPFCIDIETTELSGWLDTETGEAALTFDARFSFTVGPFYKPPPLKVKTVLSTEYANGRYRSADGERFSDGKGKLVGIAVVPPTGDWLVDNFLRLPTDAFALLAGELRLK